MDDLQMLAHHALQGADIARCRMALKLHPDLAWNRVQFAKAFFAEDRLNEAEQELEKAQALEPDRWDIRQLRGAIAMERGDWVTAENELKKSVETNPKDPKTHLALANLQHRQLKLEGARQSLLTALEHARNRGDREAMDPVLKGLSFHQELAAAKQGDRSAKGGLWKRAEAGEAEAQNTLAALLLQQPKPAYQEAMEWLRRAAEQGEALASLNLAEMYQSGRGVAQDNEAANQWLLKAGEQGSPEAMLRLSANYFQGKGVSADPQQGLKWATRAAALGFAPAQYRLGRLYYEGEIVKRDYPQAYQWFSLAQRSGHRDAKALLSELEIFMSAEERRQGRQRLEQYTSGQPLP
jgi:TPR repeat protein